MCKHLGIFFGLSNDFFGAHEILHKFAYMGTRTLTVSLFTRSLYFFGGFHLGSFAVFFTVAEYWLCIRVHVHIFIYISRNVYTYVCMYIYIYMYLRGDYYSFDGAATLVLAAYAFGFHALARRLLVACQANPPNSWLFIPVLC